MLQLSNHNTQRAPNPTFLPRDELARAYAEAVRRAGDLSGRPPGYRLFWFSRDGLGETELCAVPGGVLHRVVGRHTSADVVLSSDPHVSLRHLLVRVVSQSDGVELRVLDLESHIGFCLDDEQRRRAMLVRGPVAIRVGMNALVALPCGGEAVRSSAQPSVRIEGPGAQPPALPPPRLQALVAHPYREMAPVSRVTLVPRVVYIGSEAQPESQGPHGLALSPKPALELTLRRGFDSYTVRLSGGDLDRGVLIGRSPRCHPSLLHVLGGFVSRVHGLVVRERDEVALYDLGAMNGTYIEGRFGGYERVRRLSLGRASVARAFIGSPACECLELTWRPL